MPDEPRVGVARFFFQEIKPGDVRKLQARSNIARTGGGARDLRVPHAAFAPFLRRLFAEKVQRRRRRAGSLATLDVQRGPIFWEEGGVERSAVVEYEPPTTPRPAEGRIVRIHALPPLRNLPPGDGGRILLLVVQDTDGKVRAEYVTTNMLRSADFNRRIALPILSCLERTPQHRSARGYIDFESGEEYCHGT